MENGIKLFPSQKIHEIKVALLEATFSFDSNALKMLPRHETTFKKNIAYKKIE